MGCPPVHVYNPRALADSILHTFGQTWYNYFIPVNISVYLAHHEIARA